MNPTVRTTRQGPQTGPCATRRRTLARLCLATALVGSIPAFAQAPPDPPIRPEPTTSDGPRSDDLSQRLLRKAMQEEDEDLMDIILRLMDESAGRMEAEFDPGPETQALQRDIVDKLDEAIQAAAMNRRRSKRPPPAGSSDKRRRFSPQDQSAESAGRQSGASEEAAEGRTPGGAADAPDGRAGGDLDDIRRGWGHLPAREREELIQGVSEEYLERYRVWVERYYRALQEASTTQP